jgi:methyl-accepting chemotaxis protein PixJ
MLEYHLKKSSRSSNKDGKTPGSNLGTKAQASKPPQKPNKPTSFWQQIIQPWDNLNFRTKLAILLMASAALPVLVVTQRIVSIAENKLFLSLEAGLKKDLFILEQKIEQAREETTAEADTLAKLVQSNSIDLSNPKEVAAKRTVLQSFLRDNNANESFYIFTDNQGRTVAQNIKTLVEDYSTYPPLPTDNKSSTEPKSLPVLLPPGIALGNIAIVKNALSTGSRLSGTELLKGDLLQRLGLDKQAKIGIRKQKIEGLPELKKPFPGGTYDVDQGKAGLVIMAVQPIQVEGKQVGTAIIGSLLNRNYEIVDRIKEETGVPTVTIFARDWRVSTNVPYADGKTRAIGTRVSREVATAVLNQGKTFLGEANIVGTDYVTGYSPLYDHQKELNPSQAKPIGIAYVGEEKTSVKHTLNSLRYTGYGIGGGILLLAGLVALSLASSFSRPLRRLSIFAQQIGAGGQGVRLAITERQDEIGILSQELNQMAVNIEANLEARRQEAERSQLFVDIATSRAINAEELDLVLNTALQGAREILKADRVVIYRFNSDWSGYISAESVASGWQSTLNQKIEDPCIGKQLIESYINGRVVPTNNVLEAGFHPEHQKLMERLQIKANLVTPIVQGDKLFGLLIAHHCQAPHTWQQTEISFLIQLAAQLGLMLDRLNFVEQSKAEAERARTIKDITLHLTQSLQMQGVFDTAVQEIRSALKSDRVIVYSFDEQWQGTVIAESVATGFPHALGAKIDDPCFAQRYVEKYRQGRVQATENIYQAGLTACHIKQLEPFAVKANLVAPILRDRQLLGLLIAHQCSAPRTWQQGEIDLFSQLATQVGLALDRVNLLEQQKVAKEFLQRRALELLMEVDPVSKGDLTIRANVTEDEIGTIADSYNATILSLRRIVTQVQTAAKQVANTTTSSEDAVKELSQEALRQTEEINGALDRIQEMSNSIRAVATSAEQAEAAVQQANQTVAAGEVAMNRSVEGMMAIQHTVAETSKKVQQLGESSQKISKVLNLIGRFAAQTNLLALKASIEAARAGEEGRGFAVLADEVRVLARQSAEATAEIESLITNIQTQTNEVVAAMEAGTQQVTSGTQLLDETRQSLNKITDVSQQISELVQAIASAAVVQSQASKEVTATMTDVAAIANQTSNEATAVSASFKELLALAQELQASASQFKVS